MNEVWVPAERDAREKEAFYVEWQKGLGPNEMLEEKALNLLERGKAYLQSIVRDYPFPRSYSVIIGKRASHANLGAEMHLSAKRLGRIEKDDSKENDVEQSLIIHELTHNLCDAEDLPMLVELIYVLEKGSDTRLQYLLDLLENNSLASQYVDGLQVIAGWLGFDSPEDLLKNLSMEDIHRMKELFAERVESIREDLNLDVTKGRALRTE